MTISSQDKGLIMQKVKREELTQELLKTYLSYDTESGKFTWIKNNHPYKNRIGKEAGSVSKRDTHIEIRFFGTLYRAHILAWFYTHGTYPEFTLDHEDHDEQNNRLSNLRDVPKKINNRNQSKRKDNTSGVTGIYLSKKRKTKPYTAEIMVDKTKIYLGNFATLAEAVSIRETAKIKYGFHENHGITKPM